MHKVLTAKVVSVAMKQTVIVEVTTQKPHPLYRKLQKQSKRFKADLAELMLTVGDVVEITETRPMTKDKHFKVTKIIRKSKNSGLGKEQE